MSLREGGVNLPEIGGKYLGNGVKKVMLCFIVLLLVLVGAVFVYSPAIILGDIAGVAGSGTTGSMMFWVAVIVVYYIIATLLPIDKIIGKIYPLFAFALIFMAVGLMVCLFVKWPSIPEFWDGLQNRGPSIGMNGQTIFPCLFITIACGAISGFHATQSPMMARCMKNEKLGRPVFYGAMITEGIVALVWAAVASYFFFDGGAAEVGSDLSAAAPTVVTKVSKAWLGVVGGVLAILGVVAAPITTGDTALRSARLTLADALHLDQRSIGNRLKICIPLFIVVCLLIWFNIADENGFNTIWRYFGWANQTLSIFTLWAITVYLAKNKGKCWYLIAEIPALFMTVACLTYILTQKIGLGLPVVAGLCISLAVAAVLNAIFYVKVLNKKD
jgi:carbon starvation protein CstA